VARRQRLGSTRFGGWVLLAKFIAVARDGDADEEGVEPEAETIPAG
jgi:hypothetical protein